MIRTLLALFAAAMCFVPIAARANILWKGDFSTGDLSQWKTQMVSPDRLQIVPGGDNPSNSKYALRVVVKQGDNPIGASGNRNEVLYPDYTHEGEDVFYRWQVKFDPSFPSADYWQLFTQWHQKSDTGGSPPIQFYVKGEEIILSLGNTENTVWTTPLERGKWLDFVMRVKFSDDPKVGFIELWYNGQYVMEKTYGFTTAVDYLKLGLYRNEAIAQDGIVYHTGMVQGESFEDVMPGGKTASKSATTQTAPGGGGTNPNAPPSGGCSTAEGSLALLGLGSVWALTRRRKLSVKTQ